MITTVFTIPDTYTTLDGIVIELPKTIHGCTCRNSRQRNAAIRQGRAIALGQTFQKSQNNVSPRHSGQSPEVRVSLDKYLGKSHICRECVRNALLLEAAARCESFVKCVLEVLNPLPVSPSRKSTK
nr:MAG TPA: hypothetical protein [Caudoviricetes sp.]